MSPSTPSPPGHRSDNIGWLQIEAALAGHSGVRQAAVTAFESVSGEAKLVAYLVLDEAYLDSLIGVEQSQDRRTKEWRTVFDRLQKNTASSAAGEGSKTRGWNSTYTKQPIPDREMQEWIESTVQEILPLHPVEVLEVGCGTGLLLLRIAPTSKRFVGVDFSPASLKSLTSQMAGYQGDMSAVTLLEHAADNLKDIESNSFDTTIINSVVQYFPSLEYLTRVWEGVLRTTKPGGAIFAGDVRSLPLLKAFSTSVELFQAPAHLRLSELRERIRRRMNQERELVISPAYFLALQRDNPRISRVEIRPRWGNSDNEMTRFRYNVTLFLDSHEQKRLVEPHWLDWTREGMTLDKVRDLLQSGIEMLAIKGVVNARVEKDIEALARLANSEDQATAGDLKQALGVTPTRGVHPNDLRSVAREFDHQTEISWAACRSDGSFDVFFRRHAADGKPPDASVAWPQPDTVSENLTLHVHDPSRSARRRMLLRQVREYAKATLPEAMVPADFVLVNELPFRSD
jgi:SAM-dependent methyltransferase